MAKTNKLLLNWKVLAGTGTLFVGLVTISVGHFLCKQHSVKKAEGYLKKGYAALASATLEPYKRGLVNTVDGCKVLLETYFQSRQVDKLEWASQACLESGKEIQEAYLGLAATRELTGRVGEALQILSQAAPKFEKIPDFHYRMAQIFKKAEQVNDAAREYVLATQKAPDHGQLSLEALDYLLKAQKFAEAKPIAEHLKGIKTEEPEVKLIIAKALLLGGDAPSARALTDEAKNLLANKPDLRAQLEKAYAEVFNPNPNLQASSQHPHAKDREPAKAR